MKTLFLPAATFLWLTGAVHAAKSPFDSLRFEPNRGQTEARVRFAGRMPGGNVAFTAAGVEFRLAGSSKPIAMRWEGISANASLIPEDDVREPASYLLGADASRWIRNVPRYGRLLWRGLYTGVDAVFYGDHGKLEYDLIVAPGSDPSAIRMAFDEGVRTSRSPEGDLIVRRGREQFTIKRPTIYQRDASGARLAICGGYRMQRDGRVRFSIGPYDRTRPLVIDPVVLVSSMRGGEGEDTIVAITSFGDVVGTTNSLSFGDGSLRRGRDIFVSIAFQSNPFAVSSLVFAGGSDDDVATSAIATSSQVTIAGWTRSTDFVTNKTFGGVDGFFFSYPRSTFPNLSSFTRIGGSGDDRILAMTGSFSFVFAGDTNSPDLTLNGAPLSTRLAGGYDAFVGVGLSASGVLLRSLAYYGGTGDDSAYAVVAATSGYAIAGKTTSSDLPLLDPIASQLSGPSDGFVAVLNASLTSSTPVFATYLGGSGDEEIRALVATGGTIPALLFAGTTSSSDFPVVGAAQPQYGGGESDAILGRIDLIAHKLTYSTYFGGSGADEGTALTTFGGASSSFLQLEPVLAGTTTSPDLTLVGASQTQLAGPRDAFLASFSPSGEPWFATYFGGSGSERVNTVVVDSSGAITIAGETDSDDLPSTLGAPSPLRAGGLDGFTAVIAPTRISLRNSTIWTGTDMTVYSSIFVSIDIPSSTMLRITSSDPSRVVIGTIADAAGVGSLDISVGALRSNSGTLTFAITGLANEGEATVTIAVDGFPASIIRVRLGQPIVTTGSSAINLVFGQSTVLVPQLAVPDDTGFLWFGTLRFGVPSIRVTLALSDPALGTLDKTGVLIPSAGVFENSQVTFTAGGVGQGTISIVSSSGPPVSEKSVTITSRYPKLTFANFEVAKNLNTSAGIISDQRVTDPRLTLTVTNGDPSLVCLLSTSGACVDSIRILPGVGFGLVGLSDSGAVEIRYSNPLLGEGSAIVTLTRPGIGVTRFVDLTVPIPVGQSRTLGYDLTTAGGTFSNLRSGFDLRPTVTSSDPAVFTISEVTATSFKITAVAPGQAAVSVSAAGFDSRPAVTATAVSATAAITITSQVKVLGKNLQVAIGAILPSGSNPQAIRAQSSNPKVLISPSSSLVGSESATLTGGSASFFLQALDDSGSATITISSAGYSDAQLTVRLAPSGFAWSALEASISTYSSATVPFFVYALDPETLVPLSIQLLRSGVSAKPSFSATNTSVGAIRESNGNAIFDAGEPGITELALAQPEGFVAPSVRSRFRMTVNRRVVSVSIPPVLGKDLQVSINTPASSNGPAVTLRSDDPSLLLISKSATTPGSAEITVTANDSVYLQGLAASGTTYLRISGDKISESVYPITLGPTAVRIDRSNPTAPVTTLSGDIGFSARLYVNLPISAQTNSYWLRPGADPINVTLESTNSGVARALLPGFIFQPGVQAATSFAVRPVSAGDTIIRIIPPPELLSAVGKEVPLKVSLPTFVFSQGGNSVGRNLVVAAPVTVSAGVTLPGAILVSLTSSDPSRILVSGSADQPGRVTATVAYNGNNGPLPAIGYVHGVSEGPVTLTVSASGFETATFDINVVPAVMAISGATAGYVKQDASGYVGLNGQMIRPGVSLSLALKSSNPAVAIVDSPVVLQSGVSFANFVIHPVGVGKATISAEPPEGVVMSATSASFEITVNLPPVPINVNDTYIIGKDMQVNQSIYSNSQGLTSVTVTSADPSKLLISTDPKLAGQGSLTIGPAPFPTLYLQAVSDTGPVKLTFSSTGYASKESTVTLYPTSLTFNSPTLTVNKVFGVQDVAIGFRAQSPVPGGIGNMSLRGGLGPLRVTVSNGTPGVGTINPATLVINPGDSGGSIKFTPISAGTTILTIPQPSGFAAPAALGQCAITVF